MMELNEELRSSIMRNDDSGKITELARRNGMQNLREDGWNKVRLGMTSADELMRARGHKSFNNGDGLLFGGGGGRQAPHVGTLSAETDRHVAAELKRQGLIPVYVGLQEKAGSALKIPTFQRGRRKDILFFTQELSTLLNASVPLDRALSITAELTERANFRTLVLDIVRLIKGGKSLAESLASHPAYFSDLYVNMVRAGEASGSLSQIFDRLAEFERTRDDLRSYIVSSLIYPGLLTIVGISSIIVLLEFVVPRFALIFSDPRMTIPVPTQMPPITSRYLQTYGLQGAIVLTAAIISFIVYIRTEKGALWWDSFRLHVPVPLAMPCARRRRRGLRARWERWSRRACLWCNRLVSRAWILNNRRIVGSLERVITE